MKIIRKHKSCNSSENFSVSSAHKQSIVAALGGEDNSPASGKVSYAKRLGSESATVLEEQGYNVEYAVEGNALNIVVYLDESQTDNITYTLPFKAITPNPEDLGADTEELVNQILASAPSSEPGKVVDISEQLDVPEDGTMAEELEAQESVESSEEFKYTTSPSL